jgi:hypothetical protein
MTWTTERRALVRAASVMMMMMMMMNEGGRAMAQQQQLGLTVQAAAARAHGWQQADVRVGEVKALSRAGCAFYRASDPTRLDQAPAEYVVLPEGAVTQDAAEVLRRCGAGAPTAWWAQVIARLGGVRGVVVDEHAPSARRRLEAAGTTWTPPRLEVTPRGTALTFYTVDYERGGVHRVQANLPPKGPLAVRQVQVAPPA